jgi:hypothetical protein
MGFFKLFILNFLLSFQLAYAGFGNCSLFDDVLEETLAENVEKKQQAIQDQTKATPNRKKNPNPVLPTPGAIKFSKAKIQTRIVDPTPQFSPRNKIDALYQTSMVGKRAKVPPGYQMTLPDSVDVTITPPSEFMKVLTTESSAKIDALHSVYINEGGLNKVYLVHSNNIPPGIKPGSEEHIKWALSHGENLKVKKIPIKNDLEGLDEIGKIKSRDDALYQAAEDLSLNAKLDGKRFIRTAKGDILKGEQEFVSGPTALELRMAQEILTAGEGTVIQGIKMTRAEAEKMIRGAGFTKGSSLDLERLDNSLNALEKFYKDSHATARGIGAQHFPETTLWNKYRESYPSEISPPVPKTKPLKPKALENNGAFQDNDKFGSAPTATGAQVAAKAPSKKVNDLEQMLKEWGAIGFDFNHGKNVIWSEKEKMFIMVDI